MSVSLENVVRVSVSGPSRGLKSVNTSAVGIITHEKEIPSDFGDSKVYLNPLGVATDFGSNTETFKLANAAFAQTSNMIKGGGYLVVVPRKKDAGATSGLLLSSGDIDLTALSAEDYAIRVYSTSNAQDLTIGKIDRSTLEKVEESLNKEAVTDAGLVFSITGEMTKASIKIATIATGINARVAVELLPNSVAGSDLSLALKLRGEAFGSDPGLESIKDCILRTVSRVPYFGLCYTEKMSSSKLEETAAVVQSLNIFQVVGSDDVTDITGVGTGVDYEKGVFTRIKDADFTKTRCLYYSNKSDALLFAAGYLSILTSMDFNSGGSALTMNLKDLVGLGPDENLDDSLLDAAKKAGVDVYADIGIPKIFSHGANLFADQVYTRLALQVDLQIAGINVLATTNTKIPQIEDGVVVLKGAYRKVLARYVAAGVLAPGEWTDSTTYGNPEDHRRNITERGYFIYSRPIREQEQIQRLERVAPVIQIAAKEAGAIHSSNVIVLIEA